jgi:hypothetical protein
LQGESLEVDRAATERLRDDMHRKRRANPGAGPGLGPRQL